MRSPADMYTIEIEVTNACPQLCGNCTRMCGHHRRAFFMELPTFKNAVDSLVDFPRLVGIMGGEPTLHPQFEELLEYYREKIVEPRSYSIFTRPVGAFSDYSRNLKYRRGRRRALLCSPGKAYYKHFEIIQDTFAYQCINDHQNPGLHQALLISRRELGIPDREWFKLRDACWIQNLWSASISPKGAFFCEIAGVLDLLFDGPGGWPIEPGWWRRKPSDFGSQLEWCELCSAALPVPRVQANLKRDIVSPLLLEKLKQVGSPKVRRGEYRVFDPKDYKAEEHSRHRPHDIWYLPAGSGEDSRVAPTNDALYPRRLAIYAPGTGLQQSASWPERVEVIDGAAWRSKGFNDWALATRRPELISDELVESFFKTVLNPGCLYHYTPGPLGLVTGPAQAALVLFNRRARALRGVSELGYPETLGRRWEPHKVVRLRHFPRLGELDLVDHLALRGEQLSRRISFLLPAALTRLGR